MTRTEHIQWCKDRANKYITYGKLTEAFTSMASDLGKHPETENHAGIHLGMGLLMSGHLDTADKIRKFIDGFN